MRVLLVALSVLCVTSPARGEDSASQVNTALRSAAIPGETCADLALLRAKSELATDPDAVAIYSSEIARRVARMLAPIERLIVLASIADPVDPKALEALRRQVVFARCVDSDRVDRDLAFLRRVMALRVSGF